MKSKLLSKF